MSATNIQGLEVTRIRAGLYVVEDWEVENVKGTTGWRLRHSSGVTKWAGSLSRARQWIKDNGYRHVPKETP